MPSVTGLHHVTAISGNAQVNLDFYSGLLGMRLVKKSVNQDDPGTYHLFYADDAGHPGTDLTFFPWDQMAPARPGHGLANEVALAVPPGTLEWWTERLTRHGVTPRPIETRFGERALPLLDPHGLEIALVESPVSPDRAFTPWDASPVPADRQVHGLHAARLRLRSLAPTAEFLTLVFGYRELAAEGGWRRYGLVNGGSGTFLDVAETPDLPRGFWGVGSIHHLAFRVGDPVDQLEVRERVQEASLRPTPVIDRFWFKSVYFKEPGGVLFELATDGPGFAVDEDAQHLGETLVLPPWLEPHRAKIESALPKLTPPRPVEAAR
jgi:glyoxalase family protein